jgi:hypothetical protein
VKTPPPSQGGNDYSVPSIRYNGMLAPLLPFAVRGAIWYQGETNVGRAAQYERLLPVLIRDWRARFGVGDFPFYIVQLANYLERRDAPSDSEWARLREAQLRVSQSVPHLHTHVVPRTKGDGLRGFFWPRTKYASDDEMAEFAAKITAALAP